MVPSRRATACHRRARWQASWAWRAPPSSQTSSGRGGGGWWGGGGGPGPPTPPPPPPPFPPPPPPAPAPACAPAWPPRRELRTTVAWLDDEPLVAGRVYWALHGHRWVKAKVRAVLHNLDIDTLAEEPATQLGPNAIGHVDLQLQEALPTMPFQQARVPGSLILVDSASHKTAGAVLVN